MLFKFKDAQNHMQRLGKAAKDKVRVGCTNRKGAVGS